MPTEMAVLARIAFYKSFFRLGAANFRLIRTRPARAVRGSLLDIPS
jgi:hypothetical protein